MFSFFKRRSGGSASAGGKSSSPAGARGQPAARDSAKGRDSASRWQDPIPVPEAQDADWAMWEDSVAFQESQITEYEPTEPAPIAHPDAADESVADPFDFVHKNSA